ncbi:MAG: hypothetical protein JXA52_01905 [Planctomycetes bacterium]|nr:hypothetical protein [Planctomycetota bacterium]
MKKSLNKPMAARNLALKDLAASIHVEMARQVALLKERNQPVSVAGVLLGESPALARIAANRGQACQQVGIDYTAYTLDQDTPAPKVDARLCALSNDPAISGISLLRDSEARVSQTRAIAQLNPRKDIEGIHPVSIGQLFSDPETSDCIHPLTAAVMATLTTHEIEVYGATVLIQANPRMVGLPLVAALTTRHATAILAPLESEVPAELYRCADLIITLGVIPGSITAKHLQNGVILFDLGAPGPGDSASQPGGGGAFAPEVAKVAQAILPAGEIALLETAFFLQNVVNCANDIDSENLAAVVKNLKDDTPFR